MSRAAIPLVIGACLIVPAAANAQEEEDVPPPAPVPRILAPWLDDLTADAQLTQFKATLKCLPGSGRTTCDGTLRLVWRPVNAAGRPSGNTTTLHEAPVSVPAGKTTVTIRVAESKLRDVIARRGTGAQIKATTHPADGSTQGQAQLTSPGVTRQISCGGPAYVAFSGGTVSESDGGRKEVFSPILTEDLPNSTTVKVGGAPISFTYLGVRYTAAAHTSFKLYCVGIGAVARGQLFPSIFLFDGSLRAVGKPTGRALAVNITTYEGGLGSRTREAVDLKVTRHAGSNVSTLKVAKGRTTAITPFNSPTRSPCTTGQSLRVNSKGRISKV